VPCIIFRDHEPPESIFDIPFGKEEWSSGRAGCRDSVDKAWEDMAHLFHRFLGGQGDGFHVDAWEFFVVYPELEGEVENRTDATAFVWDCGQG